MTKFNPENKTLLTYGESLGPAMQITEQSDADQYKEAMIQFGMNLTPTVSREKAESVCNQNLGYYAGYYSEEVRERVERLFNCSHPIFGSIKERGQPTHEEAFKMGVKLGEQ
jgi:hypothetical protein